MVERNYQSQHNIKNNLNYFSEELTSELKDILKMLFDVEVNNVEVQEAGRHIAQFVLLKETTGQF